MTSSPHLVLIAYDGSDRAQHAIREASAILAGRQAIVLHVHHPIAATALPAPMPGMIGAGVELDTEPERAAEVVREHGEEVAREGARIAEDAGLPATAETMAAEGTAGVASAIVDVAVSRGASLIVLGSHGRSAVAAALLGSVSTAVLHRAEIPVLVVPAERHRH